MRASCAFGMGGFVANNPEGGLTLLASISHSLMLVQVNDPSVFLHVIPDYFIVISESVYVYRRHTLAWQNVFNFRLANIHFFCTRLSTFATVSFYLFENLS